jgi:hypothetical protein
VAVVVLTPLYVLLDVTGRQYAPPSAYLQFFYGFLAVTMAWQIAISWSSPTRFRLPMIPSIVEKLGYVVTAAADPAAARAASVSAARSRGFRSAVSVFLTAMVVAHASAEPPASTTSMPMACAPAASHDLRVYLINEAGAAQQTLDAAEAEAGTIWANAGLRLVWTFPPVPLDVSDGRTVVVVVRRGPSRPATVEAADSQGCSHPQLGRIRFGEDGRPGNLIEVSFPALRSLVMSGSYLEKPISALPKLPQTHLLGLGLGRVVAHEIGHWLMGRGHTRQGLMRPSFSVRDLIESKVPRLPRTWTAAGSELLLALSLRCELDASHPDPGE